MLSWNFRESIRHFNNFTFPRIQIRKGYKDAVIIGGIHPYCGKIPDPVQG